MARPSPTPPLHVPKVLTFHSSLSEARRGGVGGGVVPWEELEAATTDVDRSGPTPSFHYGGWGEVGSKDLAEASPTRGKSRAAGEL